MTQILQFPRSVPAMWSDLSQVIAGGRQERQAAEGPQSWMYRSEAFCEDLEDWYPLPASRLKPQRAFLHTALATAWTISLLLATVLVIHSTLA